MSQVKQKVLTEKEIEAILQEIGEDKPVSLFCMDGIVVEIMLSVALKHLPYAIMLTRNQPIMEYVLSAKKIEFLSAMTSDQLKYFDIPFKPIENINKETVDAVRKELE